jgi:hypothetical protein
VCRSSDAGQLKLSSDSGDSGCKKWWLLWWGTMESSFDGSIELGGQVYVGAFISTREDVFIFNSLFLRIIIHFVFQ